MNGEVLEGHSVREEANALATLLRIGLWFYFSLSPSPPLSFYYGHTNTLYWHTLNTCKKKTISYIHTQPFKSTCLTCICMHTHNSGPVPLVEYSPHLLVTHCCSLYGQEKASVNLFIITLQGCKCKDKFFFVVIMVCIIFGYIIATVYLYIQHMPMNYFN